MTQLLQSIYAIGPYIFIAILIGATFCAVWLITQLKKSPGDDRYMVDEHMFIKRNAARLRKVEWH
jgi:hypothetical protein